MQHSLHVFAHIRLLAHPHFCTGAHDTRSFDLSTRQRAYFFVHLRAFTQRRNTREVMERMRLVTSTVIFCLNALKHHSLFAKTTAYPEAGFVHVCSGALPASTTQGMNFVDA
eukprot:328845-Pleurochrysis_carterae.AAC.2